MSAIVFQPSNAGTAWNRPLRFGAESGADGRAAASVRWLFKRNCSITPHQMLTVYAALCTALLGIAAMFWVQGATLVMPFTGLEMLAVGVALLLFARHATDSEEIRLQAGRLTVECCSGRTLQRAEFASAWVRVEPCHGDGSLVELTGQGQRIEVGRFVRPELRSQLADELRWALRRRPDNGSRGDCGQQDNSEN
jgi:uncharacterized membrane protein